MENEKDTHYHSKVVHNNGILGGAYFLTIIGAAIYFVQHSSGFWGALIGVLQALVWPVVVMYKVLELLKL
jgi:hypothetical protein